MRSYLEVPFAYVWFSSNGPSFDQAAVRTGVATREDGQELPLSSLAKDALLPGDPARSVLVCEKTTEPFAASLVVFVLVTNDVFRRRALCVATSAVAFSIPAPVSPGVIVVFGPGVGSGVGSSVGTAIGVTVDVGSPPPLLSPNTAPQPARTTSAATAIAASARVMDPVCER